MSAVRIETNLIYIAAIVLLFQVISESIILILDYSINDYKYYIFILRLAIISFLSILFILLLTHKHSFKNLKKSTKSTDSNELKSNLLDEEEIFRLTAEYSYDWEYLEGLDKTILYVSPSCERITGYTPEEFYQNKKLLEKIITPEDLIKLENYHYAKSKGYEIAPVEFRITTKQGEVRWVSHVFRSVYSAKGENRGIRVSNRDITKTKLLKKEIKELKGLLPICSSCKSIRDDKGYWNKIEIYIRDHSEAEFSHGLCPDCAKKIYPNIKLYQ